MPEDFVIRPFLVAHRSEVRGMLLTEYDETAALKKQGAATEENKERKMENKWEKIR